MELIMKGSLVNLNVNPCRMCMPMGAVTAFYGIKKCMTILHGSQGCSTYIRRHMATHYNEPVDIASSSLTEEGTVYGGEKNLIRGLLNLIKVYQPEVIGVATTCLAETIGEDLKRMIKHFYEEYPEYGHIPIIPIHSAGYGGSQFEGYFAALIGIVKELARKQVKNNKINIVTGPISPADTRYLKRLLESFSLEYILLPDLSENLDGGYQTEYNRLPQGGCSIEEIRQMAGARYTLELSTFMGESSSVGRYLEETYGVPYERLNLPIGLRDTDAFIKRLADLSGKPIPESIAKERSRYLDAMIDSHKYNSEARAVVFGEPDYVYSTVRLCAENGIMPVLTATGSKAPGFEQLVRQELEELAERFESGRFEIMEDTDFQRIEELAGDLKANILIGSSDGRRMAERLGVSLIRRSFPIHDRVGGQRLRMLGYEGALTYLDEITNAIISKKESGYREKLYRRYYKGTGKVAVPREFWLYRRETDMDNEIYVSELKKKSENPGLSAEDKTASHPCFSCGAAHQYARLHLPIAPKCNISCNYCLRKYDCPNESRPGVTSAVLKPEEALRRFLEFKEKLPNLTVVGIAGPGDALANFPETMETLTLIRRQDPEITFCLSTNGLMLPLYAEQLIEVGVSHVTVTMNAVDPKIGAKIYRSVHYMGREYTDEGAAAILLANQMAGIKLLTDRGILCKVNIVLIKGINDRHIPEIVQKAKELGAAMTNIVPMIPVKGSVFENLPPGDPLEISELRKQCEGILKQMYHCRQCRADAAGTLGENPAPARSGARRTVGMQANVPLMDSSGKQEVSMPTLSSSAKQEARAVNKAAMAGREEKAAGIQVAVATKSGCLVDQHFGHVTEFHVYEYRNGRAVFLEKRSVSKYCNGQEDCDSPEDKISRIIEAIGDCKAVIALRIGEAPKEKLRQKGIRVYTTCDRIENSVEKAAVEILAS
jgi:nitrogenase cofactor biosynthesis protein NifB